MLAERASARSAFRLVAADGACTRSVATYFPAIITSPRQNLAGMAASQS